jgi:NADH:ubiquinone reductase (H+-translocating)
MQPTEQVPRILVLGGGYIGLYTALRLQQKLRPGEAQVMLIDPRPTMTYQPFLPEAAAGSLEPRHVVVSLRRVLRRVAIRTGRVQEIHQAQRRVRIQPNEGEPYDLDYDILVIGLGSVARTLPIPGLAEEAIGFKQIEEAIALRNHVLDRLDIAGSTDAKELRQRALSFLFVGGGYAGVEALAELEDMARYAVRYYPDLQPEDLNFVLVEATNRILPEVSEEMGHYTVEQLRSRNIDVRLGTRLNSCVGGHVVLSDGTEFDADTIVWTAGVRANPVLARSDLPLDEKGRLRCRADLRVEGVDDVWGAGDCARVPDLTSDDPTTATTPSAQHAMRQAKLLADNILAMLRGGEPKVYAHKNIGSVASLGLHKGVAQVYGVKVKGWPAWFMHRTYHLSKMPTFNRRVRITLDWTLALLFNRDVVSLGRIQTPRQEFLAAARQAAGAT